MKPDDPLKLVGEVRDLQIVDSEGINCGKADDIEFAGSAGRALVVKAILVGPGAYERRLPRWAYMAVKALFGHHFVRLPWREVTRITGHITLNKPGSSYGLLRTEHRFQTFMTKIPFA
jgi:hypothetical protein